MRGSGAARIGVLVVDDQAPVRETLRELVGRTAGMRLLGEATSGEWALREVDRLGPQLVIMDVRMPGLGGIEATRRLTRAHPGIVVLLVSVDDVDPVAVRTCGAAGFTRKQRLTPAALAELWDSAKRSGGDEGEDLRAAARHAVD